MDGQTAERKPLIRELQIPRKRNYWLIKRAIGAALSAILIVVTAPIMLILSIIIMVGDPDGAPICKQLRCGRGGKPFAMYAMRVTRDDEDEGEASLTGVGKLIRALKLDGLPQLINILLGNMVFVGPRPPLPEEVSLYNEYQFQRLYVTPGLTCYWQIAPDKNAMSLDERVELDIQYVIDRTLWLDVKLMALAVLRGWGV